MKRTVTVELGNKIYKFETGDPQSEVDETVSKLKEEFVAHSQEVEKYGNERFFLMMLLNSLKENLVLKKQLTDLTDKVEKQGKRFGN
uniref:Cell division protein ZapA n=1 Tax=Mesoaciditoga lauensis TaxID=1495039 RepID=A0A7V3REY4_9BACT